MIVRLLVALDALAVPAMMSQTAALTADILFFSLRQQPAKPVKGFIAPLAIPVTFIRSRPAAGPDQAAAVRPRDLDLGHYMILAKPGYRPEEGYGRVLRAGRAESNRPA